jgi:hypothetical protein
LLPLIAATPSARRNVDFTNISSNHPDAFVTRRHRLLIFGSSTCEPAFSLTAMDETLRRDHPRTLQLISALEGPEHYAARKHLPALIGKGAQGGLAGFCLTPQHIVQGSTDSLLKKRRERNCNTEVIAQAATTGSSRRRLARSMREFATWWLSIASSKCFARAARRRAHATERAVAWQRVQRAPS